MSITPFQSSEWLIFNSTLKDICQWEETTIQLAKADKSLRVNRSIANYIVVLGFWLQF